MPPKPPPLQFGKTYHLYNRGINRGNIFFQERNYRYFLQLYAHHLSAYFDTFAYCLLWNHYHFAVRVKTEEEIIRAVTPGVATYKPQGSGSRLIHAKTPGIFTGIIVNQGQEEANTDPQSVPQEKSLGSGPNLIHAKTPGVFTGAIVNQGQENAKNNRPPGLHEKPQGSGLTSPSQKFGNFLNAYAKSINKAYDRTGSLFQQRFGRIEVTSNAHFLRLIAYIHRNPQKHGFVDDFREWPYSSYHAILSQKDTRLKRDEVLAWFGEGAQVDARKQFIEFHEREVDEARIAPLVADDFD